MVDGWEPLRRRSAAHEPPPTWREHWFEHDQLLHLAGSSGNSSRSVLDLHTEDAFHPGKPGRGLSASWFGGTMYHGANLPIIGEFTNPTLLAELAVERHEGPSRSPRRLHQISVQAAELHG